MNKEYTYVDGKVIISNENDNKTISDYYDNLDEVLVQENLIETIEGKIEKLKKESQLYRKNNKKHYIPIVLPIAAFMSTIGISIFTGTNSFTTYIDTVFGTMSQAMAMSICFLPLCAIIEFSEYENYKQSLKKEKGINNELDFLEKQIKNEKEKLENLKQERTRDKEKTDFRTVKVDDLQQLKALRDYLNFYYDLGYNGKKYYQYYQDGKLDKKLKKYYTDTEIKLTKEYLEEKGPSLVLRRK